MALRPTATHPGVAADDNSALEKATLLVATLTAFMSPFMVSAVNVGLPAIQREFQMSAVALSWVSTAYLLASATVLVPAGKIADIYGRKRVFFTGMVIFVISSAALALASNTVMLIVLRVVQGTGSAMIYTTGMAIVTSVFPPAKRGRAIGIYVAAVYVGLSVGPTVGGVLTQYIGWRSIFACITPLGLVPIGITFKYIRAEWKGAEDDRLDLWGSLVYGGAILALIYGATRLPAAQGIYLVFGGLGGLVIFVWRQLRIPYPVFDVRLFKGNRLFAFSSLAALINYAATFAVTFLMSLYLQYIKGLPPPNSRYCTPRATVDAGLFLALGRTLVGPLRTATTCYRRYGAHRPGAGADDFSHAPDAIGLPGGFIAAGGYWLRPFLLTEHECHYGCRRPTPLRGCLRRIGHHAPHGANGQYGHRHRCFCPLPRPSAHYSGNLPPVFEQSWGHLHHRHDPQHRRHLLFGDTG